MVFQTSPSFNLQPNCFHINPFKFQWPTCKRYFNVNEPQAIFDTDEFMLFAITKTCLRKEEENLTKNRHTMIYQNVKITCNNLSNCYQN